MTLRLPSNKGEIVKKYLKTLELDKVYDVYTINGDLEIVSCKGMIKMMGIGIIIIIMMIVKMCCI